MNHDNARFSLDLQKPGNDGNSELIVLSESQADTEKLGFRLSGLVGTGSVISLTGDLGAGKTALARGLAAGLHCRGVVASPTFTILMEHPAGECGLPLYHFDAYRLGNSDAFIDLGLAEYLDGEGVSVIEWGDLISDILPERTIWLRIAAVEGAPQSRRISIKWPGGKEMIAALAGNSPPKAVSKTKSGRE